MELPSWLAANEAYAPPRDRDAFLRRNVLGLASVLVLFRDAREAEPASPADRSLSRVLPSLRLLGSILLIALVSAARNTAFCCVVLAVLLCLLALRPPSHIAALLKPALGVAAIAALVNLPAALWFGQTQAPMRIAIKTFLTVGLAANLAQTLGVAGVLEALRGLHLPAQFVMTAELTIRDLGLLGEAAQSLSEALELRSIGRNADKTASVAGVLGATFLRGQRLAAGQSEAMLLRGYDGSAPAGRPKHAFTPNDALYGACIAAFVALFIYLELAL